jgi:uncharacterized membrane protein
MAAVAGRFPIPLVGGFTRPGVHRSRHVQNCFPNVNSVDPVHDEPDEGHGMSLEPLLAEGPIVASHALAALAALIVGAVQFAAPTGTLLHRTLGYVWASLMLYIAIGSFWIAELQLWGRWSPDPHVVGRRHRLGTARRLARVPSRGASAWPVAHRVTLKNVAGAFAKIAAFVEICRAAAPRGRRGRERIGHCALAVWRRSNAGGAGANPG